MSVRSLPHTSWLRGVVGVALAVSLCACGDDDSGFHVSPPARLAVLSAFPAEMAPVLEHATVEGTAMVNGHVFRIGTLSGVPVVIGLTGIGLVNAGTTTHALLEQFHVAGIVVSAVAGSTLQIGDVAVPTTWELADKTSNGVTSYGVDPQWLGLASEIAASGSAALERCAVVPTDLSAEPVCMLEPPAIVVGGIGRSSDPFGGKPFACQPDGGDLSGCDIPSSDTLSVSGAEHAAASFSPLDTAAPIANDMETAAIAREAAARGVRFIAFRAVSDGSPDPLGLHGFLAQFSAYYHFAARNAAAATQAFLKRIAAGGGT
jgi:nucleoside phosphorylase